MKKSTKVSVEISYYPLKVEYIEPIKQFIKRLNSYENLIVRTNTMSTQVFGEYFDVMRALTDEIHEAFELPHSIFVMKIINADLR
ncbi:MAG: hypothetical protein ACLFPE_00260 [Bacteroidales bacterium]